MLALKTKNNRFKPVEHIDQGELSRLSGEYSGSYYFAITGEKKSEMIERE